MSAHSLIAPSAAGIWGKSDGCTGYVRMVQDLPAAEGVEANEGTVAHGIAAVNISAVACDREGDYSPVGEDRSGVVVTAEIMEAVGAFVEDVRRVHQSRPRALLRAEEELRMPRIHADQFGTVDAFLFDQNALELWIWDFKLGYGVVEVFDNYQLINYAAGLLDRLEINGLEEQSLTIHFRIVQPRAFHSDGPIREWTVTASNLRADWNILRTKAAEALGPNATTRSGAHCRYCPARHACKSAIEGGMNLFETAGTPTPIEMTPEALGLQLAIVTRAAEQMDYLKSGLTEQIESMVRSGQRVPGWLMEQGQGKTKWTQDVEAVVRMGDLLGIDVRKPNAITPIQAGKAGVPDEVLKAFSKRSPGAMKLTADDGSKTNRIFSN